MKHNAIVIKSDENKTTVSLLREEACCHCAGRVVCGNAKTVNVDVKNEIGAVPGDTVVIEAPTESVIGYAALIFLAPVVLAVILYLVFLQVNTTLAGVFAVCGFAVPFAVAYFIDKKKRQERIPVITQILENSSETPPCNDGR